ncbi:MAG: DNA polymerase III subunit gamma and tau, partial [Cutibacterium granulosum]
MDEDYQASNDRDADEWYDQDGPDLFGQDEPPRDELRNSGSTDQTDSRTSAAEPEQDADATAEEPTQPDDVLAGPESPAEPDGLDTDEQDDSFDPRVVDRVAELTEPADVTDDDAPAASDPPGGTDASPTPAAAADSRDTSVQNPPLALYRRYRPDTFDEVIGQEHVTEPLKRAIVNGRVNHAYLFSGPRGCGKTTSARILARCLNCEQGPTPYPCGECQSCRDLARGGPGSIDVIEIDAASHGGVDEARDLRERAFFAPVRSRYKIYIIDEAHMVTTQGFNAMLKLVEEPPPHVKFIFATTEPEKVIGTIRSRTHHYPFRLVPPATLVNYLETLCDKEGIAVDHAVLPMVVRAGGGSVRDSLSVLDQLLGGADEDGVSYELAAALLGYTPDALLDQVVDAFAAGDAHEVFATIDKVMDMGQDPRRFAEDLLRRMRDLVILAAVPDAVNNRLIDVSPEQGERLAHQAAAMGAGELTRAAEVLATGLTQMRGTTAPRLHL